jgi:hypothetical protein
MTCKKFTEMIYFHIKNRLLAGAVATPVIAAIGRIVV